MAGHMANFVASYLFLDIVEVGQLGKRLYKILKSGYHQGKPLDMLQNAVKTQFAFIPRN